MLMTKNESPSAKCKDCGAFFTSYVGDGMCPKCEGDVCINCGDVPEEVYVEHDMGGGIAGGHEEMRCKCAPKAQPTQEDMEELLNEFRQRCNPKSQTGNEDMFLEVEGLKILTYLRSLQASEKKLREEVKTEKVRHAAWTETFKTTQLTHAAARLEAAEKAEAILPKLREEHGRMKKAISGWGEKSTSPLFSKRVEHLLSTITL